ncbi:MAG TPA: sensor histidine kinase [Ideonella sp.]|nr:sensor histidine kinase [Ideonella sp.]
MIERLGLGTRLAALGIAATLLVTGLGGWMLRQSVHTTVLRSIEQGLAQRVERILVHLQVAPDGTILENRSRSADEFNQIFSGWYWQLESPGQTLRSRSLWDSRLDAAATQTLKAGSPLLRATGPRNEPIVGLRREVDVGGKPAVLYVFGTALETDGELARLDRVLLVTQAALVAALLLATLAQVRWGLRPLRRLHAALSRVRKGDEERIGHGYGPDLDPLAREMDEVLARNARVVARVRHHAADLSHALKKPLALLGAEAGAAQVRGELVRSEVASMARVIDRHLSRAGSGAGERRRIDVHEPLAALVALMGRLHGERDLVWHLNAPSGLHWSGEPTDFEEMLGNLLDNAGKWAARRVEVGVWLDAGCLVVQVQDDGPGIPELQIDEATRRGRRFDETTEGDGLGLAIVCDIAETYGGRLALASSALGGLRASLWLPV